MKLRDKNLIFFSALLSGEKIYISGVCFLPDNMKKLFLFPFFRHWNQCDACRWAVVLHNHIQHLVFYLIQHSVMVTKWIIYKYIFSISILSSMVVMENSYKFYIKEPKMRDQFIQSSVKFLKDLFYCNVLSWRRFIVKKLNIYSKIFEY